MTENNNLDRYVYLFSLMSLNVSASVPRYAHSLFYVCVQVYACVYV